MSDEFRTHPSEFVVSRKIGMGDGPGFVLDSEDLVEEERGGKGPTRTSKLISPTPPSFTTRRMPPLWFYADFESFQRSIDQSYPSLLAKTLLLLPSFLLQLPPASPLPLIYRKERLHI